MILWNSILNKFCRITSGLTIPLYEKQNEIAYENKCENV